MFITYPLYYVYICPKNTQIVQQIIDEAEPDCTTSPPQVNRNQSSLDIQTIQVDTEVYVVESIHNLSHYIWLKNDNNNTKEDDSITMHVFQVLYYKNYKSIIFWD